MCAYLLTLLKIHDDKIFNITGEHSRISPCTLPEWLPGDIIKAMVDEFGTRLKVELVKFRRRKGRQIRERSGSSETRRLSVESLPPAIRVPIERSVLASLFTRNRKHNEFAYTFWFVSSCNRLLLFLISFAPGSSRTFFNTLTESDLGH